MSDKYAVSPAWNKKSTSSKPFDYTLENSGQTCLLRRVDMTDIMAFGLTDDLDFFAKEMAKVSATDNGETSKATRRQNSKNMERMVNMIVQAGVIKPELELPPEDDANRIDGIIYVDSIPFTDRIELFSVIYDTEGLVEFHEGQNETVGNVADVQDVQLPPNGPDPDGRKDSEGVLLESGSVPVWTEG